MTLDRKKIGLLTGLYIFIVLLLFPDNGNIPPTAKKTAAVVLLMIIWWVTEAIPIYMTAFIPIVLFPSLGILSASDTTQNYGHSYVLMLLGAFILAKGLEKQKVHTRIALSTIRLLGNGKRNLILGFMVVTAFLSMWITNMAVVLIMLPIATALIQREKPHLQHSFGACLLLGIAYAASVGGAGTLIGTPPNLVLAGLLETLYPNAPQLDFLEWMKIGVPIVLLFIPLIWIYLTIFFKINGVLSGKVDFISEELTKLGDLKKGEIRVLIIFLVTAMGWVFRKGFDLGSFTLPGWSTLLETEDYVNDSTVALLGAILLFVIRDGQGRPLMDWKSARNVPWGVAMFLGGGLAAGAAFKDSGLAEWIGNSFSVVQRIPEFLIVLLIVAALIFITEVNSNTATATIFLPILAAIAVSASIHPLLLMIPATFACSFAFMLPSGTGTNTVIFASKRVTIATMAKTGFWLNLICILLLPLIFYFIILPLLGITIAVPDWAM